MFKEVIRRYVFILLFIILLPNYLLQGVKGSGGSTSFILFIKKFISN